MSTMNYFRYTRNDGSTHNAVKVETDIAAETGLGFGSASAADAAAPKGFRPRVVYVKNVASGRFRSVIVSTPAAYATLTAGGASVTLPEKGSATDLTWVVTNGRDEGFHRGTKPHLIH
jgi:hypothetical protein